MYMICKISKHKAQVPRLIFFPFPALKIGITCIFNFLFFRPSNNFILVYRYCKGILYTYTNLKSFATSKDLLWRGWESYRVWVEPKKSKGDKNHLTIFGIVRHCIVEMNVFFYQSAFILGCIPFNLLSSYMLKYEIYIFKISCIFF